MSTTNPKGCPQYQIVCECADCCNREVWALSQGLTINATRRAAKVAQKAALSGLWPSTSITWGKNPFSFTTGAGGGGVSEPAAQGKLPPMNCILCKHRNEYVGPEHLHNGDYVCRSCRPRFGLKVVGT